MQDNQWVRRTKWLTQALIISGTLNVGMLATFVTFVLKDRQDALAIELKPTSTERLPSITNAHLLRAYSLLPFQELLLRLETKELLEEGLTKRDLSLACLVAFHHFNLDKALGGLPLQKRHLPFSNSDGQESIDIPVFPGLTDTQFQAILHYAKTEKWPLTTQGLFYELKRTPSPRDSSLLDAFYLSPEYHTLSTLFTKTGLSVTREQLIDLLCEGEWQTLANCTAEQRFALDPSPDRRRALLLDYISQRSATAAKLLLESDLDYVLKRLDDHQILTLLDLVSDKNPLLENCAKGLLASPRTDAVWKRAATLLYAAAGEPMPEPYNHQAVLQRFLNVAMPAPLIAQVKEALPATAPSKKKVHVVETGDTLWKIARKYRVSIDEIKRVNHLETEKLRPGKQLEIPEKKS